MNSWALRSASTIFLLFPVVMAFAMVGAVMAFAKYGGNGCGGQTF